MPIVFPPGNAGMMGFGGMGLIEEDEALEPLPRGWDQIHVVNTDGQRTHYYLCHKTMAATEERPQTSVILPRSTHSKALGTQKKGAPAQYWVEPQPDDLLKIGWEQILIVPELEKKQLWNELEGALLFYYHANDAVIQLADPRPPSGNVDELLPPGWGMFTDDVGDTFYANHDTGVKSYMDPRCNADPEPSTYLMRYFVAAEERGLDKRMTMAITRQASAKKAPTVEWLIGPCDLDGYDQNDERLITPDQVPRGIRENWKKYNRYKDILPTPSTKVTLAQINDDPLTEYINANFIRGADNNPKAFLAAMGPKPSTLLAHWRMIWQEKPPVIVMITGLQECGREKCARYWPAAADGKTMLTFGDIRVIALKIDVRQGYTVTTLKCTGFDSGGKAKRSSHTLQHYWFTAWPDHGVPRKGAEKQLYVDDVLRMLQSVNNYCSALQRAKKAPFPIMVHCSAGIGRTGTYIAADHMIKELESVGQSDPLEVVDKIRNDRGGLVQHATQFQFVHEAAIRHAELRQVRFKVESAIYVNSQAVQQMSTEQLAAAWAAEKMVAKKSSMVEMQEPAAPVQFNRRRSVMRAATAAEGEFHLGVLKYQGKTYEFLGDPAHGGEVMGVEGAEVQSMPMEFFRLINKSGTGHITVSEYKACRRQQIMVQRLRNNSDMLF